jgi:uncharacterized membrane protein YeaQ/YmgE (transglycosylase-associated protein family)
MSIVYFLLIGLAAGWLAGQLMSGGSFGLLGNLIIGVLGAILGGFVFTRFGILPADLVGELICATAGAVLLLFLLKLVEKRL